MNRWRCLVGSLSVAYLLTVSFLLSSCSTTNRTVIVPPEIKDAKFVGNKVGAECHTNYTRIFSASPHARVYAESSRMVGLSGCESCHGPGSKHVAGGGGRGKSIINPRNDPATCFQCHLEIHAEFNLPQRHPVLEGKMSCVQCHDPHGVDIFKPRGGLAMARLNQSCSQCHRDQSRPFVFEHEALREGCIVCHTPHGTINSKMLVERDANLCLRCHAQVQSAPGRIVIGKEDHTLYLKQGTCFSAGCHTAVHGSNVNPHLRY